jgi:hypothetical protein
MKPSQYCPSGPNLTAVAGPNQNARINKLEFNVQTFNVEMIFAQDMSLQSEAAKGSASDRRETDFRPGPQGFLMTSYRLGEDGDFRSGNRILHTYAYQSVGEFQLPEQVSINRESHHEVWHYKLTGCTVKAAPSTR